MVAGRAQHRAGAQGPKECRIAKTFNPFSISGASHMSEARLCRGAGKTQAQPPQAAGAPHSLCRVQEALWWKISVP